MDPQNFPPPMPGQFRPVVPAQQSEQFVPVAPQQFQPVARGVIVMNAGFPPQTLQPQFPQVMQQLPARPGQPGHIPPAPLAVSLPTAQPNRHVSPGASLPQPYTQTPNNYVSGVPASNLSSSYTFAPSSYGQVPVSHNAMAQYQPMAQLQAPCVPVGCQVGIHVGQSTSSVISVQQIGEQPSVSSSIATIPAPIIEPMPTEEAPTDWIEHTSANGRRYYYNKKTQQSSWEKPLELMTPIERADASTNWKEFTSPDGRKYYHNKVTNQSTWSMPEELKLAREQVEMAPAKGKKLEVFSNIPAPSPHVIKASSGADTPSTTIQEASSSPVPVAPVLATSNIQPVVVSGSDLPVGASSTVTNVHVVQTAAETIASSAAVSESSEVSITVVDTVTAPMNNISKVSSLDMETVKDVVVSEKINNVLEEKAIDQEPLIYASKHEAKDAFKALLESANVGSDWTWDQAMRLIINDKRYGALRTLGERKQAFNEFLGQKKKQEAEERRIKQKKAREEYRKMLEECLELTSSTRWSKAVTMFEDDEKYKAVERDKDRKDLFENYVDELRQKERVKAQEQHKQNIMEYRQFLESCDFIKANSQWRKVQDRLETNERCSRLEKIDRLEIFQEYTRDLEKEEEEQRKIQKEELRKAERKNRDEFRKLMEGHVAAGTFTAKTHWRDYCMMVKDSAPFVAVASNTAGSTPKDLFEDVAEELQKQYHDDKVRVKDAVKLRKISLASTWTLEDLRAAIAENISSPPISDVNLKLVFEELLERVWEKEEKEAKKRKRLFDDFFDFLHSTKEITLSSTWEDCKHLFESNQEFSSIGDEDFYKGIFDEYITLLKEGAKEKERRWKEDKAKKEKEREGRKTKHGRDKERGHEREKDEHLRERPSEVHVDVGEIHDDSENKRSGKGDGKKHRKRHQSSVDNLKESEKDRAKNTHGHSSDRKKSKKHASTPESDSENRHKRPKGDHRNGSHRNVDPEELEDGEFGEKESR
ncbi:pre-mRNA-processing protein 40A-like isoform X2 [Durio zibethinus]|nr:pre-mRNA-processing protein 40A-like isoform X2 [Durio zibethinus]